MEGRAGMGRKASRDARPNFPVLGLKAQADETRPHTESGNILARSREQFSETEPKKLHWNDWCKQLNSKLGYQVTSNAHSVRIVLAGKQKIDFADIGPIVLFILIHFFFLGLFHIHKKRKEISTTTNRATGTPDA